MALLQEVEEIRKREEQLEQQLSSKLEYELNRISVETQESSTKKVIKQIYQLLNITDQMDLDNYDEFLKVLESRWI